MTRGLRTGNGAAKAPQQANRHWELFADWCAATGRSSLPTDPATVVAFLAELPTGPATVARRVRAIDAAHRGAAHLPPGEAHELDEILGRRQVAPRFDAEAVAKALKAIPVGGWPTGIVGRRDAAIVALVCAAGLTRAQVQALRTGTGHCAPCDQRSVQSGRSAADREEPTAILASIARTETAGSCPACALSRWLHVAAGLERSGWRTVRAELADLGEVPAGAETAHDCAQLLAWPPTNGHGGLPLFCAIDRHGAPETGWALSTRSITAIVASRLHVADQADGSQWTDAEIHDGIVGAGDGRRQWGTEDRRRAAERFAEVDATLDQMEAEAEAIMARVKAAMGEELESDTG